MADRSSGSKDPFDVWREWLDRAEQQVNAVFNDAMSSRQFSQAQGKLMEVLLGFQKSMNEASQRYFSTLNVPTRSDVIGLAERLTEIEERLAGIEHALRSGGAGAARRSVRRPPLKPKRTRRPPAAAAAATSPPVSAPSAKRTGDTSSRRARTAPKRKTATKKAAPKKAAARATSKPAAKKQAKRKTPERKKKR